ncbi:MAG: class I SAM-dependent methyltransferase [Candidatus Thiodiazotropha sp. (ex Lucinoma borealis)]|nr:class I SAM-dependent methyltransferase [Candidatus Thiodiazotropha sp. (ex Lucinoma borealis)]
MALIYPIILFFTYIMQSIYKDDITRLEQNILNTSMVQYVSDELDLPPQEINQMLQMYLGEVNVGLELLRKLDLRGKRVLEVGSGLGLLTHILNLNNINVVGIEPGSGGFSTVAKLGKLLREKLGIPDDLIKDKLAQDLTIEMDGEFDVLFSVNVLEHIPDILGAFSGMTRVMRSDGIMRHICPNYTVPYEPHFGIPLIPFKPRMTYIFKSSLKQNQLWKSLNFITTGDVQYISKALGLKTTFDGGLLVETLERLDNEISFSRRHSSVINTLNKLLRYTRIRSMLKYTPAHISTPMRFTCQFRD